jgi:hypothetical protein
MMTECRHCEAPDGVACSKYISISPLPFACTFAARGEGEPHSFLHQRVRRLADVHLPHLATALHAAGVFTVSPQMS